MASSFEEGGLTFWKVRSEDIEVQVVPERGALICSVKWEGEELLYLDRETLLDRSKNVRGGIPVLFPLCGPVREGRYQLGERTYELGQHGFARQSVFQVSAHGEDFIELILHSDASTLAGYPFEFTLLCRYRLAEGRLWLEQEIVNRSSQVMPFQIGYHPYFLVAEEKRITWLMPASSYRDNEKTDRPEAPFSGFIDLHQGTVDWEFLGVSERQAGFQDLSRGLAIKLEYGSEFPYLVVWSVPGKPFVCLEPWSSPRFGMNDDVALIRLEPGASAKTAVCLKAGRLRGGR